MEISRVLTSITPLLAKNGYWGIGGQRFKLDDNFPKELAECVKTIKIYIPDNILSWFEKEVYNSKNTPLYLNVLKTSQDPLIRHFVALLILRNRPPEFKSQISTYIKSLPKNSYYLGNLSEESIYQYATQFMNEAHQKQMMSIIAECYEKSGKLLNPISRNENRID